MKTEEYEVVTFSGEARSITIDPELAKELGIEDIPLEVDIAVTKALAKFLGKE